MAQRMFLTLGVFILLLAALVFFPKPVSEKQELGTTKTGLSATLIKTAQASEVEISRKNQPEKIAFTKPKTPSSIETRYQMTENGVKEEIVLNDKNQIQSKFTYELKLTELKVRQGPDKLWYFFKDKAINPSYYIPKPFMVDGAGVRSESVAITHVFRSGKEFFELTADENWLKDPPPHFPGNN